MENTKSSKMRKMRAKYRRSLRATAVLCLIIGLAAGFVLGRLTVSTPSSAPVSNPVTNPGSQVSSEVVSGHTEVLSTDLPSITLPASTATAAPTPTPAPTATPAPQVIVVPFESNQHIVAQIAGNGQARLVNDNNPFETLSFTLRVTRYLTPEYYVAEHGASYNLEGNETAVEFDLMLNDYMGAQSINPQNILNIQLENAAGAIETGYKLTDAEIDGQANFNITTNVPNTLYKRFKYSATAGDMKYLVVTAYNNGAPTVYKFELGTPVRPTEAPTATPAPTYAPVDPSSSKEAVMQLQERLIKMGFLAGNADGAFGPATENAVKTAQATYGLPQTGIADNAFQQRLYSENQ